MKRPKGIWGTRTYAQMSWVLKAYRRVSWYGIGIGHWFIGVQHWREK